MASSIETGLVTGTSSEYLGARPLRRIFRERLVTVVLGPAGVGKWQSLRRNVYDDYKRAFNEEPGLLKSVGVMTDTDNTGTKVEAWYGDLVFQPADK